MAVHDSWAFDLASRAGATLGALEVHEATMTFRLNGPSEARVQALASSPGSRLLEVHSSILRAFRRPPWQSGVTRTARFAGEVHGPLVDSGSADGLEAVEFTAKDPWEALRRRLMWTNFGYAASTLDALFTALVGEAVFTEESPAGPQGSYTHGMGVVVSGGGWPATAVRGWPKWAPFEDILRELWEPEQGAGFWWDVRPVYPPTSAVWAAMNIRMVAGSTRTARLEYGPGTLANVAEMRVERQGPVNSVLATGKASLAWQVDSEASAASYGLWPVQQNWPDVDTTARLDQLARGLWQVNPTDLLHLELAWPNPSGDGLSEAGVPMTPMLWDDFDLGDSVPFYVRGERRTVSGVGRVREATVEVTPDGSERLAGLVLEVV